MILGMSTSTFTMFHVVLSLVGIFAGLVAVFAMFGSKLPQSWTVIFLAVAVVALRSFHPQPDTSALRAA